MELKPGYKQTEVGVIPQDWEVKSLVQMGNPVRGGSPRPAGDPRFFNGSYIPWLTVAALTNIPPSQLVVTETATCLTEEGSLHSRTLQPGTLIIANSGATLGVAKILGVKCCANDGIAALLNTSKDVNAEYLAHFINTKTTYLREVVATGNGQPNLNTELIGRFKVPFPPSKAEQEAIAEELSDAEALIESLEQLLVKKRHLKQGAMQELLTGKKRLPGFSGEWEVNAFEAVLSRVNAKAHQIQTSDYQIAGRYPVVDQGKDHVVGFSDRHEMRFQCPQDGVIVFGDHTCIIKFVNFDFLVGADGTQVMVAKEGQCARFHACQLQHRGISPTGYNRHFKFLKERDFVAPAFTEQTAIAAILSDMDAEIAALEAKLAKNRQIKKGMMQELLTGRIRLV